jgi:hypothetical protein
VVSESLMTLITLALNEAAGSDMGDTTVSHLDKADLTGMRWQPRENSLTAKCACLSPLTAGITAGCKLLLLLLVLFTHPNPLSVAVNIIGGYKLLRLLVLITHRPLSSISYSTMPRNPRTISSSGSSPSVGNGYLLVLRRPLEI